PCPSWEEWTEWSSCSSSCGEGLQTRSRECNTIGGCEGKSTETRACDEGICAEWLPWNEYSECSKPCGYGNMTRTRECTIQDGCDGRSEETKECHLKDCWLEWNEWSECSATCGSGSKTRSRSCSSEVASDCPGNAVESAGCTRPECTYSEWTDWSPCSQSCHKGTRQRQRECLAESCEENLEETEDCFTCCQPLDSNNQPVTKYFYKIDTDCTILNLDVQTSTYVPVCNKQWGTSVLEARKTKKKCCLKSDILVIKANVNGIKTEVNALKGKMEGLERGVAEILQYIKKEVACRRNPVECTYSEWTDWSPCSQSCHKGTRQRQRECLAESCEENLEETEDCFTCKPCSLLMNAFVNPQKLALDFNRKNIEVINAKLHFT
ncbi:unnamed protein product, partial [Owenia fusiformis]